MFSYNHFSSLRLPFHIQLGPAVVSLRLCKGEGTAGGGGRSSLMTLPEG